MSPELPPPGLCAHLGVGRALTAHQSLVHFTAWVAGSRVGIPLSLPWGVQCISCLCPLGDQVQALILKALSSRSSPKQCSCL